MPKNAEFLMCQGEQQPGSEFLLEYQKCILHSLQQEGILTREQLAECITRLEQQRRSSKNA